MRKPYRKLNKLERKLKYFYRFWRGLSASDAIQAAMVLAVLTVFVWWFGLGL